MSGFRSRELIPAGGNSAAGRSNHLVLDDTDQKIQAQLKSDHQHSQLSLGHITRIEDNQGRKDHRGEGFELRTDGHGVMRAKEGLLISTEARPNAQGHAKDMGETTARLNQAQDQHDALAELAKQHQAQDATDQGQVAKDIKDQNAAIEGKGGAQGKFQELAAPHIAIASPAGIQSTTAGSTHQHSQKHHAITSGGHTSISTSKSLLASAKEAVRLFAYKSGIRLVSAKEDIDIQALKTSVHLLAKMDITMTANRIEIKATESVTINGSGSYTVWNAGAIKSGTTGAHVAHAVSHGMPGAKSQAVVMPSLPFVPENAPKKYSIQANAKALMGVGADKKLTIQAAYRAYNAQGEMLARGAVKADGTMGPVFTDKPESIRFVLGDGDWQTYGDAKFQ